MDDELFGDSLEDSVGLEDLPELDALHFEENFAGDFLPQQTCGDEFFFR